jgi:hypothetical protein
MLSTIPAPGFNVLANPKEWPMKTNDIYRKILAAVLMCGLLDGVAPKAQTVTWPQKPEHPQLITGPDGSRLSLLGVTQGTEHIGPYSNRLYAKGDTPVVWIEIDRGTNIWQEYRLLVSDQAGTACVNTEVRQRSSVGQGKQIYAFVLDAFPRWDAVTVLRACIDRSALADGQFIITNPPAGPIPEWTPKPLPDTENDGDLSVTLTKLIAGAPAPRGAAYYPGRIRAGTNELANQCVRLDFDIRQNDELSTNWQAWPVETSDAAGNHASGLIYGYPASGVFYKPFPGTNDGYFYQSGLWPDEPVWKLRMELIQRSGYSEDEIVTFTNLPVRVGTKAEADDQWTWDEHNTNWTFVAQARVNGMEMKLLPPLLVADPDQGGQKSIGILVFSDAHFNPKGMNVTVLQATDDQGRDLWSPFGVSWAGHYNIEIARVNDTKTLNLKLALHKSRFVEFTVKPARP